MLINQVADRCFTLYHVVGEHFYSQRRLRMQILKHVCIQCCALLDHGDKVLNFGFLDYLGRTLQRCCRHIILGDFLEALHFTWVKIILLKRLLSIGRDLKFLLLVVLSEYSSMQLWEVPIFRWEQLSVMICAYFCICCWFEAYPISRRCYLLKLGLFLLFLQTFSLKWTEDWVSLYREGALRKLMGVFFEISPSYWLLHPPDFHQDQLPFVVNKFNVWCWAPFTTLMFLTVKFLNFS